MRGELVRIVDGVRLVTLVGAPGCGKTRLGLELRHRLADRYPAGVGFVELAPVGDGCLVASAVAAGLGIDDQPRRSAEDALIEELSSKALVVVLDNCEHLVGAVAALVARLLDGCPSLRVLATSRTALGLRGEQVWRVPPLDLAPRGRTVQRSSRPERDTAPAPIDRVLMSSRRSVNAWTASPWPSSWPPPGAGC